MSSMSSRIVCPVLHMNNIKSLRFQVAKCISYGPEQPTAIDRFLVAQILSNLQSFNKVPNSGTLFQY